MKNRSKFGWLDCLLGVALVALGVYTAANPGVALPSLVAIFSILAIVAGIADIVFYVRLQGHAGTGTAVSLVSGILSILAGCMLLLNPVMGRWIFSLVFAVWFIAHSVSRLANYKRIRAIAGRTASVISLVLNSVCVLLGAFMLVSPALSATALGYLVAIALTAYGAGNIAEAFSRMGEAENEDQEDMIWQ